MKIFTQQEFREAMNYADNGGEAVHVFIQRKMATRVVDKDTGRQQNYMEEISMAHLYDRDPQRLLVSAVCARMPNPTLRREGERGQHVLFVGERAVNELLHTVELPKPPQVEL